MILEYEREMSMKKSVLIFIAIVILVVGILFMYMRNIQMEGKPPQVRTDDTDPLTNEPLRTDETPLPIPPMLEDMNPDPDKAEFHLTAQKSTKAFFKGKETATLGYNGDYLGPVLKVREGEEVSINVKNNLDESTTVHWHGLEVNGEDDGGPHSRIPKGETWNPQFTINQPAATLWYHPHLLHKTSEQVYRGLAGLFYIEDGVSDSLNIPKEYGVDDIPLIIQDKKFDADGNYNYDLDMQDRMMGLHGDVYLINGEINPYLEVPQGKVRFRLLNGSNARTYQFQLSNGSAFQQIASDGGFLEQPAELTELVLSSAERAEIILDFSDYNEDDVLNLTDQGYEFMTFVVTNKQTEQYDIPSELTDIPEIDPATAVRTREFVMQGMGANVNINGKQMDMDRIDEEVTLGDTEIWEISNDNSGMMGDMMGDNGGMAHPFHAHGVQFQILDRDGQPPPANERGWKDTILVYPGENVKAIATFDHPGRFMYHCHILEHEDAGMMGQFNVE